MMLYLQELNAVMLYVVILVPSQFLLPSLLPTPVLVRYIYRKKLMHDEKPGYEDVIL